jgi:hypothetical protein
VKRSRPQREWRRSSIGPPRDLLTKAGCVLVRQGRGIHEIWAVQSQNVIFPSPSALRADMRRTPSFAKRASKGVLKLSDANAEGSERRPSAISPPSSPRTSFGFGLAGLAARSPIATGFGARLRSGRRGRERPAVALEPDRALRGGAEAQRAHLSRAAAAERLVEPPAKARILGAFAGDEHHAA